MRFVSLHTHTTYSTGDGYGTPKEHIQRVKQLGMTAVAFSEHGNVSSWVELEKEARKADIQPIFGLEAYVGVPNKQAKHHLTLLAMNQTGLANINRMVSQSYVDFYYKPTITWKTLKTFNEGIIVLSGCAGSQLSGVLLGGKLYGDERVEFSDSDFQSAIRNVQSFQSVFGDRYYLEVQRFSSYERTCILNPALQKLSEHTGALLVATADVHYPLASDQRMQSILYGAHRNADIQELETNWELGIPLTYPESDEEMIKDLMDTGLTLYQAGAAIMNTQIIAKRCAGVVLPKAPQLVFPLADEAEDIESYLKRELIEGLKYRNVSKNDEYRKRMRYEFEIISSKPGFMDYFCTVADIVKWAKSQGIAVGPGRGSAAASLICYLLQITEINPMNYPMMFERFIDPQRSDLPDIDIDFEDERRHEVFEYARSKYGEAFCANIGTFTGYKGKNSLDDVARVYKIPKWAVDSIKSKLIERPEGHARASKTILDTINTYPEIKALVKRFPQLEYAPRLEGNIRNFGVHAAGLVISSVPINDVCATYSRNGVSAIAYDKYDAVYLNLLKIDVLSLSTLSMIRIALGLIGKPMSFLYEMELDDEDVFKAFEKGNVLGIFQYEGGTTRRICKDVAPNNFQQIADINALSRPGPLASGTTNDYKARKHEGWDGQYLHRIIEQHTSWTYGLIVYQEQVLGVIRDLGNFPPASVNRIRNVIQYKLGANSFNELYGQFVKGAAEHGLEERQAADVWDRMVSSAGYSFNIAHSVSYAKIAYWSMWLKVHHPAAFYTASLIKCGDGKDDIPRKQRLMREAKASGLEVLPPDVLRSTMTWAMHGHQIIAGLTQIKGIGDKTAERIVEWRNAGEEKHGLDDFYPEWEDLVEIKGIGPKTIQTIKDFSESDDPFGLGTTARVCEALRWDFDNGNIVGVPHPTHVSAEINGTGEPVVFMGIPQRIKYYDAIEQLKKRSKEELSTEQALEQLDSPELIKYCAIECEDDHGETVFVRLSRWTYPRYAEAISLLELGRDIIVAKGNSSEFGGISVQTKELYAIDPYSD